MTADQHAKVKAIFLKACAMPVEQRASFLADTCADDKKLHREVGRLLSYHLPPKASDVANPDTHRTGLSDGAPGISELPTFETGDVVAARYRIVALLGEGAMGRVYRAEDDRLHQAVALKFLPRIHVLDPTWRRRVEREVNLSREVGHSNICRVYDLGDVDGSPFISMEYIDGEDLASLLRRIGRLTGVRAVEMARQLCIGLAAAHVHGVLHRDLKPANVMIDQKGRVRITDFGLAVITGQVDRREIRAGTPRYMAPEQLAGVAVNEKSDIYSLGLVLYDMFTGRPAFDADNVVDYLRLHQTVEPTPPSTLVPEIDAKVEAVILACLRKDPAERPDSALNVAAALPGGDLLAAALDAGQIPTREMLATAAAHGSINRRRLNQAAIIAMVLLVVAVLLGRNTHLIAKSGGAKSPEVLIDKSREVARFAGIAVAESDVTGRYLPSTDAQMSPIAVTAAGAHLSLAIPAGEEVLFHYRSGTTSSRPPASDVLSFIMPSMAPFQPELESDSSTTVILDGRGRLLLFESKAPPDTDPSDADWQSMVRASGYDPQRLTTAQPLTTGAHAAQEHRAFRVPSDRSPEHDVRIEIATSNRRVQSFAVLRATSAPPIPTRISTPFRWTLIRTVRNSVLILLVAVALPGAWKNWRNRGDLTGAARLGAFVIALRLLSGIISIRSPDGFATTINELTNLVVSALCEGMIVALFYLAMESHIRRLWPRTFGGWSRILAGRFRDPFVGRDILIGSVVGNFWAILIFLDRRLPEWLGWDSRTQLTLYQGLDDMLGVRSAIAGVFNTLRVGIYQGLAMLLLLIIATWLTGSRRWVALLLAGLIGAAMYAPVASHPVTAWTIFALGIVAVALYLLTQWGLVSLVSALLVAGLLVVLPITTHFGAWYAGYGFLACATIVGLVLWSLHEAKRPPILEIHPLSPPLIAPRCQ